MLWGKGCIARGRICPEIFCPVVKVLAYGSDVGHHCCHNQLNWPVAPRGKSSIVVHSIFKPHVLEHSIRITGGEGGGQRINQTSTSQLMDPPTFSLFFVILGKILVPASRANNSVSVVRVAKACACDSTGLKPSLASKLSSLHRADPLNACGEQMMPPPLLKFREHHTPPPSRT